MMKVRRGHSLSALGGTAVMDWLLDLVAVATEC